MDQSTKAIFAHGSARWSRRYGRLTARRPLVQRLVWARLVGLLGDPYSTAQMTYDLRRLRVIRRLERQNRYVVTPDGIKVAVFYTKLHDRLYSGRYWLPIFRRHPWIRGRLRRGVSVGGYQGGEHALCERWIGSVRREALYCC